MQLLTIRTPNRGPGQWFNRQDFRIADHVMAGTVEMGNGTIYSVEQARTRLEDTPDAGDRLTAYVDALMYDNYVHRNDE